MIRVLRLNDSGVRQALRHPLLAGGKLIGRGVFSAIFEGNNNSVMKLTADSVNYRMLNGDSCVKHRHFPKVVANHTTVGKVTIAGMDFPLYLYEVEKLQRLHRNSDAGRLAWKMAEKQRHWAHSDFTDFSVSVITVGEMTKDTKLPRAMRNALAQLEAFILSCPDGILDMHFGNFMQRANGELVLTDPLFDAPTLYARRCLEP